MAVRVGGQGQGSGVRGQGSGGQGVHLRVCGLRLRLIERYGFQVSVSGIKVRGRVEGFNVGEPRGEGFADGGVGEGGGFRV